MSVLVILALTGLVTVPEALSGFSNPAVITVGAVLVISGGLLHTGVAGALGRGILRVAGSSEARIVAALMATAGLLSGFINNVGALAVLMPAAMEIARRTKISPSKLLIPLSFGCLLGGMTTLIGSPPNILASQYLSDRGLEPFSFFDFTPVGAAALVVGILFMSLVGRRLIPSRRSADDLRWGFEQPLARPEVYHLEERLFEVRIPDDSSLDGKSIGETHFRQALHLRILGIVRDGKTKLGPDAAEALCSGDMLLVKGRPEEVARLENVHTLELEVGAQVNIQDLESRDTGVVEAVLAPHSDLVGKSLRQIRFRDKFGLTGLAIWRRGKVMRTGVADTPLEFGDAILMQGPRSKFELLRTNGDFLILEAGYEREERRHRAPYAVLILLAMVGVTVFGLFPISMAMVIGAGLMIVTGCLSPEEAYGSIDWRVIFLLVGMLPAGIAMEKSGAAQLLGGQMMRLSYGQPFLTFLGLLTVAILLSQIINNAATIVLMAPIAFSAAQSVGGDPRIFLLGSTIACHMA
ncbi:MAG: SLC13 family permease, partial [Dehalococcoidia bacterium]